MQAVSFIQEAMSYTGTEALHCPEQAHPVIIEKKEIFIMSTVIRKINYQTWMFDEGGVYFYLLCGDEKALLLDTGMNTERIREQIAEITSLPVELMNTHADRDHVGGNHEFEWFYMHPAEASNLYNTQKGDGVIRPVYDGDVISLGGRDLRVIELPGHTPGSIAVLDVKYKALYSGDPIQDGRIFMFGIQREMHAYRLSLKRLDAYRGLIDEIYPCHGTVPVKPELIDALYDASEKVLARTLPYDDIDNMFGAKVRIYHAGCADFMTEPE